MSQSNLKNMIVLKNLPSNLVEEAIVILKTNKRVKKLEKVDKNKSKEEMSTKKNENDYILKEAELLVSNYISGLEERKNTKKIINQKINQKYKRIKNYAFLSSLIILIETIILFVK